MANLGWTVLGCLTALGIRDLILALIGRLRKRSGRAWS